MRGSIPRRSDIDSRAQAHTLEAIVASLLILSSVLFALQMTAVTPLSASTSNQHIQNQQRATASGVLASASETGALHRAVLFWNESGSRFHESKQPSTLDVYTNKAPPNQFGAMLNRSFTRRGIAYNVNVIYRTGNGNAQTRQMVYQGAPSDNAVSATRILTLTDDDVLYDENVNQTNVTISESDFYAPDVAPDNGLYNVIRVEVTVWRI